MSAMNLTWRDIKRLAAVGLSLMDDDDKEPSLQEMVRAIRSKIAKTPVPEPDPDFVGFSNPPSPLEHVKPEVMSLVDRVRAEVVKKYGEEYAVDLWERLQS